MIRHIYADNAATTKLDINAFHAMTPWLLDEYGNASQSYTFARKPKKVLADARTAVADCIGALPEEIYFTSGGTESDNWALKGAVLGTENQSVVRPAAKSIITSAIEHHAILNPCRSLECLGYSTNYLIPKQDGMITPDVLEAVMDEDVRIVSIMFGNNEIGSIQPIKKLCEIAHSRGALFHTDAVQAVGHVKIDAHELGVDLLSSSAHKFNGPKGIGFLYIRKGVRLGPYMDGGVQERGLRAGTENIASIVGMAEALKINCRDINQNEAHIRMLEKHLLNGLKTADIHFVRNGGKNTLPGIISLSFDGVDGEAIFHRMDLMGISISTGSACDSVKTRVSHVLRAIGLEGSLARGTIRISLGRDNTEEEIERIVQALCKILKQ